MTDRVFQLKVPADAGCLKAVRAFVTAMLAERLGDDADKVVLALDEACANVVRHRSEALGCHDLELTLELTDRAFRCRLSAFCAAGDLPKIHPRDAWDDRPGGLGTQLIARIMDRIEYEPDPDRPGAMALVLEKRLPKELP